MKTLLKILVALTCLHASTNGMQARTYPPVNVTFSLAGDIKHLSGAACGQTLVGATSCVNFEFGRLSLGLGGDCGMKSGLVRDRSYWSRFRVGYIIGPDRLNVTPFVNLGFTYEPVTVPWWNMKNFMAGTGLELRIEITRFLDLTLQGQMLMRSDRRAGAGCGAGLTVKFK